MSQLKPASFSFLFLIFILIEIGLLIGFASDFGVLMTLAELLISAALGGYFIREMAFEKLRVGGYAKDFILFLVAGILLIIPGLMTDVIGVLVTIPSLQSIFMHYFEKTGGMDYTRNSSYIDGMMSRAGYEKPDQKSKKTDIIIDAEFEDVTDNKEERQ
jgi:UPF0716 protein FxsA